ncbi:MAG: zinc-ribbon domain-containing protein [Armatimonadetes bacterium]|nr:zinc-ribbon domain-containing protein [Armatimonadota bacterium]MDW8121759.1 FHA domain-containing protein [Armatimonadota bacterium]
MKWLGRSYSRAVFGAVGGFLAWLLVEPFTTDVASFEELFRPVTAEGPAQPLAWIGGGALLGFALFALEDFLWGMTHFGIRKAVIGVFSGALGMSFAFFIGGQVFSALGDLVLAQAGLYRYATLVLVRGATWSLAGVLLGAALGLARGSVRGAAASGLGGLIGGATAGLLFDTLAPTLGVALTMGLTEPGWGSRLIGLVLLGALIGLFSAISETVLATARLKVISSGRLEGREFVADKPIITIGRSELCDIALYYDPTLPDRAARLQWQQGAYWIIPESNVPLTVNNRPVRQQPLRDEDVITVGETKLIYRTRSGPRGRREGATRLCQECGSENRPSAHFCRNCGAPLADDR